MSAERENLNCAPRSFTVNNQPCTVYFERDCIYYEIGENEERRILKEVKYFDLTLILIGMLLYTLDIFSDIFVATKFFLSEHYIYGSLTLAVVILSSVVNTFIFDEKQAYWRKYDHSLWWWWWWWWIIFPLYSIIGGDIIYRFYKVIKAAKTFRRSEQLEERVETHYDYYNKHVLLNKGKSWEYGYESIPQISLQIYIIMDTINKNAYTANIVQYVSLGLSFYSILSTTFIFHIYDTVNRRQEKTFLECLWYSCSQAVFNFCHAALIGASYSAHFLWTLDCISVFGFGFTVWYYRQRLGIVKALLSSFTCTIFTHYRNDHFRIFLHVFLAIEDICLAFIWYWYTTTIDYQFKNWWIYTILPLDVFFRFIYIMYNNVYVFQRRRLE